MECREAGRGYRVVRPCRLLLGFYIEKQQRASCEHDGCLCIAGSQSTRLAKSFLLSRTMPWRHGTRKLRTQQYTVRELGGPDVATLGTTTLGLGLRLWTVDRPCSLGDAGCPVPGPRTDTNPSTGPLSHTSRRSEYVFCAAIPDGCLNDAWGRFFDAHSLVMEARRSRTGHCGLGLAGRTWDEDVVEREWQESD